VSAPDHIKHLGLHLSKTILSAVEASMSKIEPKLVNCRILATTPPTDTLHWATLVNTAFPPVYNHVFMALPVEPLHTVNPIWNFFTFSGPSKWMDE
jgi:hypothetical protein